MDYAVLKNIAEYSDVYEVAALGISSVEEMKTLTTGKKCDVQRYKGLGEMDAEQLWDTTMDYNHRTLIQITIEDSAEADQTFSTLMGDKVPPRKKFIEDHAHYANLDI